MSNLKVIELGGVKYNADWLRSVSETRAIQTLQSRFSVSQIRNAWKQANGLTKRNYQKEAEVKAKETEAKQETKTAPKAKAEEGENKSRKPRARKPRAKKEEKSDK